MPELFSGPELGAEHQPSGQEAAIMEWALAVRRSEERVPANLQQRLQTILRAAGSHREPGEAVVTMPGGQRRTTGIGGMSHAGPGGAFISG